MTPPNIDRLYDLLADRAVQRLTSAEDAELQDLLAKWPHVDADGLDAAAAAVAAAGEAVPMPPHLAAAIRAEAPAFVGVRPRPRGRRKIPAGIVGWAVAAAVLAAVVGREFVAGRPDTPAARRDALLADAAARPAVFAGPAARVVWSAAKQEGYLEVTGLPPNDPGKSQYQLWIVDAGRADAARSDGGANARVDGGVFDVGPSGTAVVPVRAALPVFAAAAVAVTEESPGGVVVSRAADNLRVLLSPAGP